MIIEMIMITIRIIIIIIIIIIIEMLLIVMMTIIIIIVIGVIIIISGSKAPSKTLTLGTTASGYLFLAEATCTEVRWKIWMVLLFT